tara:strand:- start:2168 stop:2407 length:240 start_codon:yes stop_codon:yes gene_type:complete
MNSNTPKAIIVGSIIIAVGFFFNSAYERQLSYNKCVSMMLENPADSGKYSEKWWIEKACDWNVYVMKGNWRDLIPNIKE